MKLLLDLLPRCNKVVENTVTLDQIINYMQLLQLQVKVTVNHQLDSYNLPILLAKDLRAEPSEHIC